MIKYISLKEVRLLKKQKPKLNIAATCPSIKSLGPGSRFVIWVQGCCFACAGCSSPQWRESKEATLLAPEDLAKEILETPGIDGVTISGGEPMLQADLLWRLVKEIRTVKPLSIICYTGFTLKELKEKRDLKINAFISEIDVLIDGLYIDKFNDNKGLRGSSNQKVHFLSGTYKEFADSFLLSKRKIELHLFQDEYLVVGIKPHEIKNLKI
ncbi:4Fe-4S single cluster domain-containing protein [Dethiobacter alkaliphilus]|uniref:4Fe-4S single cluster domain-containing protein n=1 Tax=Dethiobacter alkaliphilus TaxID=427926 RepID=UPI002225E5B1|nr:4Fe-4S single cluster domain-containing protein [Dethiobacter alkaliphilus]MCW3488695.1 radical SAM protein [Dethiobacter alkaliphilus]